MKKRAFHVKQKAKARCTFHVKHSSKQGCARVSRETKAKTRARVSRETKNQGGMHVSRETSRSLSDSKGDNNVFVITAPIHSQITARSALHSVDKLIYIGAKFLG